MLHFFCKGKTDMQKALFTLEYTSDSIMDMLSKWSDSDLDSYEDGDTSQGTSKNSHATKNTKTTAYKNQKKKKVVSQDDPKGRREEFEKDFWQSLDLPVDRIRIWKSHDLLFKKQYKLLQQRQDAVEDTGKLHMQNEELKTLLKQQLQANINLDLIVPPTDVIRQDEEIDF